jgi:hypothetical protein
MRRDHHADSLLVAGIGKKQSTERSGTVDPIMHGPPEHPGSYSSVPPPSLSLANQYLSAAQGMGGIQTPPTRLPSIFSLLSKEEISKYQETTPSSIRSSTHHGKLDINSAFRNL